MPKGRLAGGIPVALMVVMGCYGLSFFTAGRFENKKKHKAHTNHHHNHLHPHHHFNRDFCHLFRNVSTP
jgi:hypothetical protein